MEKMSVEVTDYGGAPIADHNMPCPICRANKAVLNLSEGTFEPCWDCKTEGWRTTRFPKWICTILGL